MGYNWIMLVSYIINLFKVLESRFMNTLYNTQKYIIVIF